MEREADATLGPAQGLDEDLSLLNSERESVGPSSHAPAAQPTISAGRASAFADFDSCAYLFALEAGAAELDPVEATTAERASIADGAESEAPNAQAVLAQDASSSSVASALDDSSDEAHEAALQWALAHPSEHDDEAASAEHDEVDFEMTAQEAPSNPDGVELSANGQVELHAGDALLESMANIPQKMAFKIGEAAEMIGVKQYVLRYWESEFDQLRPKKSKNNQRVYSRRDVETALMIKKLLYVDRFSIEGARAALRQLKREVKEERGIKAVACAHESAVKGLKQLLERIENARLRFAERL